MVPAGSVLCMAVPGRVFDFRESADVAAFIRRLIGLWKTPDSTVPDIQKINGTCLAHADAQVDPQAVFEGPRGSVEEMVQWCRDGSPASDVTGVEIAWGEAEGEQGFQIRY